MPRNISITCCELSCSEEGGSIVRNGNVAEPTSRMAAKGRTEKHFISKRMPHVPSQGQGHYNVMDTHHRSFPVMTACRQCSAFCPSTLYTDARPILSALAMSTGRMACVFNSRTRDAAMEGGRPL